MEAHRQTPRGSQRKVCGTSLGKSQDAIERTKEPSGGAVTGGAVACCPLPLPALSPFPAFFLCLSLIAPFSTSPAVRLYNGGPGAGERKVWLPREPGQPAPQRWRQGPRQLPRQAPHARVATGAWHVPPPAGGPGLRGRHRLAPGPCGFTAASSSAWATVSPWGAAAGATTTPAQNQAAGQLAESSPRFGAGCPLLCVRSEDTVTCSCSAPGP